VASNSISCITSNIALNVTSNVISNIGGVNNGGVKAASSFTRIESEQVKNGKQFLMKKLLLFSVKEMAPFVKEVSSKSQKIT
jgi:hypothetical protein